MNNSVIQNATELRDPTLAGKLSGKSIREIDQEILSFDLEKEVRSDALASLGLCYLELREWELAKDYFLQASAIGVTKEREKTFHFYLGIAYFYTEALPEAKREFEICEEHASEYELPTLDVYAWLSSVSKRLGQMVESERYGRLARPS